MRHDFVFNPNSNGGEMLSLATVVTDDDNCYHELSLDSYSNNVTFTINGELITPTILRKLADELELFFKNANL